MTTFVGMQSNFLDAIANLMELEYDAIEAYEVAIEKLSNQVYKDKLSEFLEDHKMHVEKLGVALRAHHVDPPEGPSMAKQWITKGKVIIANIFSDAAIMSAMLSNEIDTNTAYERINARDDKIEDILEIIKRGLEDERRHKAWLESI